MLFCSELLLQRKELGYLSWSCYLGLVLGLTRFLDMVFASQVFIYMG